MLDRTNYRLIVLVAALLAWSVASNLAALLITDLEPAVGQSLAGWLFGSQTLAIIVAAAALVLAPIGVALLRRAPLGRDREAAGYRPIKRFEGAWEALRQAYPVAAGAAPRQFYRYARAVDPSIARIDGTALYLSDEIADALRAGRAASPADYDYASFVVLHELAHARSGDARLAAPRETLVGVLIALLAATTGLNAPLSALPDLAITLVLGTILVAALAPIAQEIEKAADAFAATELTAARGRDACTAVVGRIARSLSGPALGTVPAFSPYPALHHRIAAFAAPRRRPLLVLWAAALFLLTFSQQMRIDATCNDCAAFYQAWYDLTALLALGALTVLVIRFLRGSPGEAAPARPQRLGAVAVAAASYGLARWIGHWHELPDWIGAYGPFVAVKGLFLSSDAYTWLIVGHLILCLAAAAWPRRPEARADGLDRAALPTIAAPPPRWGAHGLAGAYHGGRVVSLAVASVMLLGALMQSLRIALSAGPTPPLAGPVFNGLVGALALVSYWTSPHRRVIVNGRPIRLTSLVYGVEGVVLLVVALAMLFLLRLAGTAGATPAEQIAVGQVMKDDPEALLRAAPAALGGFLPTAVLTILAVGVMTVLRIRGASLVGRERGGRR